MIVPSTLTLAAMLSLSPAKPQLVVDADACLELDASVLYATLEHALGAGVTHRGAASAGASDTQVMFDCGAQGEVELFLHDPITQLSSTRTLALPEPERRAEQLGWAAAAAIRASWSVLEEQALGTRTARQRRALRISRRPTSAWLLGDSFVVRGFLDGRGPAVILGEQAEVLHRPLRHLAWKADGELAYFRVPLRANGLEGRVNTLAVSVAPVLMGWGEFPSSRPRGRGTVALYGGAGLRIGGVRMRSETFGDSSGFELFAGPLAAARASVSFGRYVRLAAQAELGWALHGPDPSVGVPLGYRGPWAAGALTIVSAF